MPVPLAVQSSGCPPRRAVGTHASAFSGMNVTIIDTSISRAAGALIAGAMTSILLPFRRATVEERKEMLQREDLSGLRALCNALRVKKATSKALKDELVELIEQTLAYDDAIYQQDSPAGKLAVFCAGMPDSNAATNELVQNFKLKDLKQFCSCLRLPLSGKKAQLARSLVGEMRYTLAAISASTAQEEDLPPAAGAGATTAAATAAAVAGPVGAGAGAVVGAVITGFPVESVADESREVEGFSSQSVQDARRVARRRRPVEASVRAAAKPDEARSDVSDPSLIDVQVTSSESPGMAAVGNPSEHIASGSGADATYAAQEQRSSFEAAETVAEPLTMNPPEAWAPPARDGFQSDVVQTQTIPDAESRRQERRRRRRVRWEMQKMNYIAEELAGAYGGHKENYMRDMRGILDDVPEETYATNAADLSDASNHSRSLTRVPSGESDQEPLRQMVMLGEVGRSRKAWCKSWDNTMGCGELLDLDDQQIVAVDSNDLQVAVNVLPRLKYLVQSEIVEYRRVEVEGKSVRAVLVRGMHGWPLRCEMDCQA